MILKKTFAAIAMATVVMIAGCNKDKDNDPTPLIPQAVSSAPANDATDVETSATVSISFNKNMDAATISSTTFTLLAGTEAVAGAVTYADSTATFTPTNELAASTLFTATLTTGAKDVDGLSLEEDYTFSFTTGLAPDRTAPTVTAITPQNDGVNVSLSQAITVTFSEEMDAATINTTSVLLASGTTAVTGAVTYTGMVATFTPAASLQAGLVYTATVTVAVSDLKGNAMAAARVWSFTTDVLPTATATSPLNNATGVARNKVLSITFSEAMDASTVNSTNFVLKQGTAAVAGSVNYSGTVATFTPTSLLTAGTVYTATVTTGVKDLGGNALAVPQVWSFTTGTVAGLAVVNLGMSGDYVILAKTAINNIPNSAITGDLGLSPAATSFITGFALTNATGYATSPQVTGKVYAADMASPTSTNLTTAVENMITAYNDAAGRPTPDFSELGTGNIGGQTLAAGLYKWTSTVTIPSDLVISGTADDVWIFQISGDLTMSSAVNMTLSGGAQAKNIFWQVAGEVTIGTTSHFEGVILSMTGITMQTGASMNGIALAQTAVILDQNTVVKPQ
ncbi:ice-binding family protein [Imperialibacter roseus]|uniref:Ice-binding family protein n=1 Tax=Imperialibacter roseus TaxID=1324217 RepID=A0ABZ0IHN7_9BACT|nr:ice-binding family protein [Imperialibacter roseus]WOK04171.1 ice-binding family protein [Imperialibacter roseus]